MSGSGGGLVVLGYVEIQEPDDLFGKGVIRRLLSLMELKRQHYLAVRKHKARQKRRRRKLATNRPVAVEG